MSYIYTWIITHRVVFFFKVAAGREWFIHAIYTVRSRENANRNIGKRSVEYLHHSVSTFEGPNTRHRRAASAFSGPALAQDIGVENSRGTNIQHIALDRTDRMVISQRQPWSPNQNAVLERPLLESSGRQPDTSFLPMLVGIGGMILLICLIATIVILLLLRRKRKEKEKHFPPYTTSSSSAYAGYKRGLAGMWSSSDSSEV